MHAGGNVARRFRDELPGEHAFALRNDRLRRRAYMLRQRKIKPFGGIELGEGHIRRDFTRRRMSSPAEGFAEKRQVFLSCGVNVAQTSA